MTSTLVNTNQHESETSQHESCACQQEPDTRQYKFPTSLARVNRSQNDSKTSLDHEKQKEYD